MHPGLRKVKDDKSSIDGKQDAMNIADTQNACLDTITLYVFAEDTSLKEDTLIAL